VNRAVLLLKHKRLTQPESQSVSRAVQVEGECRVDRPGEWTSSRSCRDGLSLRAGALGSQPRGERGEFDWRTTSARRRLIRGATRRGNQSTDGNQGGACTHWLVRQALWLPV